MKIKNLLSLIFLMIQVIIYSQSLDIKILSTKIYPKKNIKIKIKISNNSDKVFKYNKKIDIDDINKNNNDSINFFAFYDKGQWINIPKIQYGKYHIQKNTNIKILPHSNKTFTINLKNDLTIERYRGFLLNMNILEFKVLTYLLKLCFINNQNEFENYELSDKIDMSNWRS
ncbi:hypothetical protein NAL32_20585 [Chryseobacterium sp. Ch-15]|uniref:Uncharacterized protein n=1 Tax=Chryseobacterium muglaense TaxID=2893752 RepID=A0A9Q3UWR8_9FLAO|nr:hypothetical protein [Chryseobacterium muglaense]MBD3907079.1 hypothetical protein [Chryseobacterium muglaense]MCC9036529.1 hypothetical protein [Chryseobacterium muglaense]MCM2556791.1 hypothetical protein [Chryseobacterium muglaense]